MINALSSVLCRDMASKDFPLRPLLDHQNAAIAWLKAAHDSTADGGVGYGYYLRGQPFSAYGFGWRPSYVETSGYIIETFYDIAEAYNDADSAIRAEQIGRWLLTMQNIDGAFSNMSLSDADGIVFDTGQVLFGLLRCYLETNDPVFQSAAGKSAYWLERNLGEDGAWRANTHLGNVHTYNTRTAWAMLEYCKIFLDVKISDAARRNLHWALTQQTETGLFDNCSFKKDCAPDTHTIAYAIRGLFEGGVLLDDERMHAAAHKAALKMSEYVAPNGFIPGRVSTSGKPDNSYSCLTGNCQLAITWFKMSQHFDDPALFKVAEATIDFVLKTQNIETKNGNVCGGVKGSHPVWGRYSPLAYPNWATKFLIDAILVKQSIVRS